MKRITLIFYTFVVLLCVSCGGANSVDLSIFTRKIYTPTYASGFEILGSSEGESTLIKISSPWQGYSGDGYSILILRGDESAPEGFGGAVVRDQTHRVVTMSSSNLAMYDALGEVDRVVGCSGLDYVSSPRVHARASQGVLHDVGYDTNLNFELITAKRPDLVLLYSVAGGAGSVTSKFDELQIPYTFIGDYTEEHPLGKAEWMILVGELCGVREQAKSQFEALATRYNSMKEQVAQSEERPKVMLNTPYRDVWYMPPMGSYMVRLIEDAGGQLSYQDNTTTTSQPISIELAYTLVKSCDFWLNTGATTQSLSALRASNPKFANMAVVKRGDVFNNSARSLPNGGSDFWESGVVNPDLVLRDLISILHAEVMSDSLYYYKQLK
ncbi:MAG: ABC transporter substrate-binding protein [Rikenellaceae bacterium]